MQGRDVRTDRDVQTHRRTDEQTGETDMAVRQAGRFKGKNSVGSLCVCVCVCDVGGRVMGRRRQG